MVFEWSHVCGEQVGRFSYRLDICVPKEPLDEFKKGGNGKRGFGSLAFLQSSDHGPSIQHPHGLRLRHLPLADHVEVGHEED